MVPSRCVKSEYMKRFKEPKWEACGPCYQELLRYRLSRRLLEQAHRPWFWDGWEQDGSSLGGGSSGEGSGGGGSPSPPDTSSPPAPQQTDEEEAAAARSEPEAGRLADGAGGAGNATPAAEPLPGSGAPPPRSSSSAAAWAGRPPAGEEDQEISEEKSETAKNRRKSAAKGTEKPTGRHRVPPASRSTVGAQGDRRRGKSPQRTETTKEMRHPFALYGWGEKQTDTGSQRTHNVCASASENEIHESALRAKNRRQVEKRKLSQRRIHSAEVERTWRVKPTGADNPWMTEYMRCYSARAR